MWGDAITAIVTERVATLRAVNPRTWIEQTNYREQRFGPALKAFMAQRAELMVLLEGLDAKGWARTATVTGAGKPLQLSVLSYAERLARHERPHVKQIARALTS
jgi:hypothetical protein